MANTNLFSANGTGYTAIVAAFGGELNSIREKLEGETIGEVRDIHGIDFFIGEVYGLPVIIFKTNIGLINAAIATQLVLERFDVDRLLFAGVAGGLNRNMEIADVVVPARWHYYAFGGWFGEDPQNPGQFLLPNWFTPQRGNFGMIHPGPMSVIRAGMTTTMRKEFFEADADLLSIAEEAAESLQILDPFNRESTVKIGGSGTAGPAFMDNFGLSQFILQTWGTDSVDMESTAIAHVCWTRQVPFLIIRGLSDIVGNGDPNEFSNFTRFAEDNAASLLNAVLLNLADDLGPPPVGLWSQATGDPDGWKELDWFGSFFSEGTGPGWIFHNELGWMNASGEATGSIWFWSTDLGWIWSGSTIYPFVFSSNENGWLWYQKGSSNPRWFFNFVSNEWFSR